jgi:hypothetical protein
VHRQAAAPGEPTARPVMSEYRIGTDWIGDVLKGQVPAAQTLICLARVDQPLITSCVEPEPT